MRTIKHGVLSFGLVAVPIGVAGVKTGANEPKFRTLHEKCGNPIHRTERCETCDEIADVTVKGYEVAKGQFVTFTEDELASVSAGRDTTIELTKFVRALDIKPVMIEKSYWLVPPENQKLAEKYGLLYQSLAESKKVGLGTESLWGKESPCAVAPNQDYLSGGVLQLHVLHLHEDMIAPDFRSPIPGREEKKLAKMLIDHLSGDFDPEKDLVTESRLKVGELIAARIEGGQLPVFAGDGKPDPDVELMESLRASMAEVEEKKTKKKPAAKKKTVKV